MDLVQIIGKVLVGINNVNIDAEKLAVSITKAEEISLKSVNYEVLLKIDAN